MKKSRLLIAAAMTAAASMTALAGGLLHNTNQHIDFVRMMARGASTEVDAVFTNPAGTAFIDHEGFTISFNMQSAFQTRDVLTSYPLFAYTNADHSPLREYEGEATAPVIPSLYGVYRKDRWAANLFFGMIGGGGKCNFKNGLSLFDASVMSGIYSASAKMLAEQPALKAIVGADALTPDMYSINTSMKGRQYIFGVQLGGAYRITDWLSASGGLRVNYLTGNYKGHIDASLGSALRQKIEAAIATLPAEQQAIYMPVAQKLGTEGGLTHVALDTDQKGWGVTPIIGIDFKWRRFNFGAKYEFKTNLHIENDTKQLVTEAMGERSDQFAAAMAPYAHGVNTPNDLPSVLYLAAGYEFIPNRLRGTVEYHFYDDRHAEMAGDRQKALRHGTHEVLAGVEWDINRTFTVSCGFQNTDYGLSDDFQTHTSFSCDSYSIGFGGAVNINSHMKLNVGYFFTNYKKYNRTQEHYLNNPQMPAGSDTFSRTNKVFGIGLDYKF